MKAVPAAWLAACFLLSGCSAWDGTLDYVGLENDSAPPPAAEVYAPPPSAPAPQAFVQTESRPAPAVPPLPGSAQAASARPAIVQHGSDVFCDTVATQQSNKMAADGGDAGTVADTYIGVYNSCASVAAAPMPR